MSRSTLLHIDFPYDGPWGHAMADALRELAASIAAEPGLRWKLWLEDAPAGRAGGAYLFDTPEQAQAYLDKHRARLADFGIRELRVSMLGTNDALGAITRAPSAGEPAGFTTLARVRNGGFERFLQVFSTAGRSARMRHGSRAADAYRSLDEQDAAWVLIDWRDRAAFEGFRADPTVRETMRSGGALGAPEFHAVERAGRFDG